MRLIEIILIVGIILIPSISSVSLGDGFYLPNIENLETHVDSLWSNFKKGYGIVYNTTADELHRFRIFANNMKMIVKHNLEHDLGLHTFRLGVNKYAAMVNWRRDLFEMVILSFRQIKNFVKNLMDIDMIKNHVYYIRIFVVYIFLHHLISLFQFPSIGVIKVWWHQSKIKPNVVPVGHLARYVVLEMNWMFNGVISFRRAHWKVIMHDPVVN